MNWWERYSKVRVGDYLKFVSPEGRFECSGFIRDGIFIIGHKYKVKRILKDTISEGHIPYINALIDSEKGGEYSAHWGTFEVVERTPKIIKQYGIVNFMKENY